MTYCQHCHVHMSQTHETCPICGRQVKKTDVKPDIVLQEFPKLTVTTNKALIAIRILLALSTVVSLIVGLINFLTYQDNPTLWSLIIIGIIFYIWLFIAQVVLTKRTYSKRILNHVIGVSLLLVIADLFTGWQRWSLTYAIPFILLATTVGLPVVVVSIPKKYHTQVTQLLKLIALDMVPLILFYVTNWMIPGEFWPVLIAAWSGFLLLICMFIIAPKTTIQEIYKQLHV